MKPNEPTRRIFGTDATLKYQEQLELVEKTNSKVITRLFSQVEAASMEDLGEISQVLTRAQAVAMKGLGGHDQEPEPSEEQLARAIKK